MLFTHPRALRRFALTMIVLAPGSTPSLRAQTPLRGPNILVGRDVPFPSVETTVAVSPLDARTIVGAAIVSTSVMDRVTLYVSRDGGVVWRTILLPGLPDEGSGDPQVAFDSHGTGYASALGLFARGVSTTDKRMSVQLYRSTDAGGHWNKVAVYGAGAFTDHPQMALDPTEHRGGLIATALYWDTAESPTTRLVLFRSTDGGNTFRSPLPIVADSQHRLFNLNPLFFSDGALFVPIARFGAGAAGSCPPFDIGAVIIDHDLRRVSPERPLRHRVDDSNGCGAALPYAKMAFAISRRASGDRLFALLNEVLDDKYVLTISHSDDRGRTWSPPTVISPSAGHQFRPAITVDKSGVVGLSWCEIQSAQAPQVFSQYFAASHDNGESFSRPVLVSATPSPLRSAGNDVPRHSINSPSIRADGSVFVSISMASGFTDAGEYTGLASDDHGVFHPFWSDSRTGMAQVWTASVYTRGAPLVARSLARTLAAERVSLVFDPSRYDSTTNAMFVPIRLRNDSFDPLCRPVTLEIVGDSAARHPVVLNSDNHAEWLGARFDYAHALGDLECLPPGQLTDAVTWRVRPLAPAVSVQRPRFSMRVRLLPPSE
jgi:hypothetical protein